METQAHINPMTLDEFNAIPYGAIMHRGLVVNGPEEGQIYMTSNKKNIGQYLKWIAKKGGGDDWAIYCQWSFHGDRYVLQQGDKVTGEENIRLLVSCTDEVYKKYRR